MKNRNEVRDDIKKLNVRQQQEIVNNLLRTRQEYTVSKTCVSFPQFFFACNQPVFNDIDKDEVNEFIQIDDANIFVDNAIYYMVLYINKMKKETK